VFVFGCFLNRRFLPAISPDLPNTPRQRIFELLQERKGVPKSARLSQVTAEKDRYLLDWQIFILWQINRASQRHVTIQT
jgi:hypothetical protein